MKKISLIVFSFILVLMIGTAGAQDNRLKERPRVLQRTGEVTAIDFAARSMILKPLRQKEDIVIAMNESTLVKMNREKKSISDIKVGDIITVWFFERDKSAKSIDIKPPKPLANVPVSK